MKNGHTRFEKGKASVTGIVAWLALLVGLYNVLGGYWGRETARWNYDAAQMEYRAAIERTNQMRAFGYKVGP